MNSYTTAPRGARGFFDHWQGIYAERGIATIPCGAEKTPLVKHPERFGRDASREIATKFPDARAFGYYAGRRNGITVLDVDTTDEKVLAAALDRHGHTPIIVKTGSGKYHALYRHNGERRSIRAWKGLPIDLLGAGLCIAPPSIVAKGQYEIIEGHLDDLDRLPIMREIDDRLYADVGPRPRSQMFAHDGRNVDFFPLLMREAHHCDDYEQLLDRAETLNSQYGEPMEQARVIRTAKSVWGYTERGENRFGTFGSWSTLEEVKEFIDDPDGFYLLSFLRAHQGPDATFMVANGLAEIFGWRRHRLADARQRIIERGHIKAIRQAGRGHPGLYQWVRR
jgi:hypothetical protein